MRLLHHETELEYQSYTAGGYKYRLTKPLTVITRIRPNEAISTPYITLNTNGHLTLTVGYASDGPSGPTIDTPSFMRGAFAHDAFYQLMREGLLDKGWREPSDRELCRICIDDGMWFIRAGWVYQGLQFAGGKHAKVVTE